MRIVFVVNPVAGRQGGGASHVDTLVRTAETRGVTCEVCLTRYAGHAKDLALAAVAAGADVVAAWGGDGTVNAVASAVAGTSAALAIVPAGSGNGLARALRIPLHVPRAIDVAIGGRRRVIDVGLLNGACFVNVAGAGFDAQVAWAFNAARRGHLGLLDYTRLALREFRRYRPVPVRVVTASRHVSVQALLVAVANSPQYGNGARIAPAARLDDGLLDVVVVERCSLIRDAWRARRLFTGTIDRDPAVTTWRAASVRIESDTPLVHHLDGEPCEGATSLEIGVRPRALSVVVPEDDQG